MQLYYIPHKLIEGDITHLADNDSKFAISKGVKLEDIVKIESTQKVFRAVVTDISKNSVEVEILEEVKDEKPKKKPNGITVIQAVSHEKKFNFFLEKVTEIGVARIIPLVSDLVLKNKKESDKSMGLWRKIIKDATEQSRNKYPPELEMPVSLKTLKKDILNEDVRLCLATENVDLKELQNLKLSKNQSLAIMIGPESGWSFNDIVQIKDLGFDFVRLKGNILRTETTGMVVTSIVKYIREEL